MIVDIENQLNFNVAVYAQLSSAANKAWNQLPGTGKQMEELYKKRQGPDELFQEFVSQLRQQQEGIRWF